MDYISIYFVITIFIICIYFSSLTTKIKTIMVTVDDLVKKVADQKTVEDSLVTLLGNINTQLKEALASGDQSKLQALSDSIDANTKELSDAVTANTTA